MSSFNEAQIKAITHINGPMLVLAGPGSGKTLVITYRTKYLIEKANIRPENILVIIFTKAATNEMKERFNKITEGRNSFCTFGTFHSIFFSILRRAYNYGPQNVLSEEEKRIYIKEIINKLHLEYDDEEEFLQDIIGEISFAKGEMVEVNNYNSNCCASDVFVKIYKAYEQKMQINYKIDFDDMMVYCYELFKERKDILSLWQNKYKYILIDEFQDINRLQYEIVKMLAASDNNLFVVGDDDQSIYGFRGAKPEIMLGFKDDYKDSKEILLNINYRSSRDVIEAAHRIIKNNTKRFQKDIIAQNQYMEKVNILEMKNQKEQNTNIARKIIEYNKNGIPYSDMAILFRTNTEPRLLIEKLLEFNIPFKMRDNIPNIYTHWISENIITYIKLALGDRDRSNILKIINRPKRYISRELLSSENISFEDIIKNSPDKKWVADGINKLIADLNRIAKMTPFSAINYIRKGIGYDNYLKEYADYRRIKYSELDDVLEELLDASKEYNSFETWFLHIEEYSTNLKEKASDKNNIKTDAVTLSTMHSAKGLEFNKVFVIDVNEGVMPHKKSVKPMEIKEERRLFYVAVTRAKSSLNIYYLKELYNKNVVKSRFINEMLLDRESLKAGVIINHKKYGKGTIMYIDSKKMSVYFHKLEETRSLSTEFAIDNILINN